MRNLILPLLATLASALVPLSASAASFEEECARQLGPTQVSVVPDYGQPVGDYSLSYKELTARSPTPGAMTLGLTEARLTTEISYGTSGLKNGQGQACSRPQLKVVLRFDPMKVFVGREFQPGTCEFQHIFVHELRHVKANQGYLAHVAQKLQGELANYYGSRIFYGDPAMVGAQLKKEVEDTWMPRAKAWLGLVSQVHASIDTPQEYGRSKTACGGAINRILQAGGR